MDDEDLAARKHGAANDPAFPARREAAFGDIVGALDRALTAKGYVLKGTTWTRLLPEGRTAVHLQRSRYGWDVQIILRLLTAAGDPPTHPDWPEEGEVTLVRFGGGDGEDPGRLAFLDVLEKPACLVRAVEILIEEALPWLETMHFSPS